MKGTIMTIKKDLKDIGIYMITPAWSRSRHPEVNFKRAATQSTVGALILQVTLVGGVLLSPLIAEKFDDAKTHIKMKLERFHKKH
jgi:hypothetical protein